MKGRIELRLRELDQLFDSFDPAPFHEKDLDRDAEEFIVSWASEYPVNTPLVFRLHLPEDQRHLEPERTVQEAVRRYFSYRADLARLDLRRILQLGRASLIVGVLFLAACTAARELWLTVGAGDWTRLVDEGLLIIGWVAMWRPLELLLYEWWPVRRRRRTFMNLADMRVEVLYTEAAHAHDGLAALLRGLEPELQPGVFTFVSVPAETDLRGLAVVATMREREGLTVVLPEEEAKARGWPFDFRAAWITLRVASPLAAVGLTAAVASALRTHGIACNVIAGRHHDHLFVPVERARDALACLSREVAR